MFRHHLLLIYRNFRNHKSSFLINIAGLSAGLACTLLIYLWVNDELHVDKFHKNDSRLYQVMENQNTDNGILTGPDTPDLLARTMADEIPEIDMAAAVTPPTWFGNFLLTTADENKVKAVGQFAGKDYFKMFSYGLLQGDKDQVLMNKNSVVISEKLALKLFNTSKNIIGKTIDWELLNIKKEAVVSGVFKGTPSNSSTQFDFVLSYGAWLQLAKEIGRTVNWDNAGPETYLLLKKGTNIQQFNAKIAGFIKSKLNRSNVTLFATPYSRQYLYGHYENGVQAGGRIRYVRLFSIIALFILLIACINFMNLSTARASRRFKEIGIKKVAGISRKTLITQFMGESVLITVLSLLLAILIVVLVLPRFNEITGKQLSLHLKENFMLALIGITLFTGIVSGSYPALYLSGFNPVSILKTRINRRLSEIWIRKGLVIFQFTLSVILIVSMLIVYRQVQFIQTRNLGYNRNNIISIGKEGNLAKKQDAFIEEVKKLPGVINASSIGTDLMGSLNTTLGLSWPGKDPNSIIQFECVQVNYGLIETLKMKMAEGRSFSRDYGDDKDKLIFNQAAINVMGLNHPVGKTVNLWGKERQIIGVVKDFNFETLHKAIGPLFMIPEPNNTLDFMIRLKPKNQAGTIAAIRKIYSEFNPGFPFNFKFMDQEYQNMYSAETREGILSRYFAALAILISCLGLFALAAFTAERKIKEIGIRKVMGSGSFEIVRLLTGEFTGIVLIAIIIALPVSYSITHRWLQSFAYRTNPAWWVFLSAGIAALGVAWMTVSFQSWRAATRNPVEALRYE